MHAYFINIINIHIKQTSDRDQTCLEWQREINRYRMSP